MLTCALAKLQSKTCTHSAVSMLKSQSGYSPNHGLYCIRPCFIKVKIWFLKNLEVKRKQLTIFRSYAKRTNASKNRFCLLAAPKFTQRQPRTSLRACKCIQCLNDLNTGPSVNPDGPWNLSISWLTEELMTACVKTFSDASLRFVNGSERLSAVMEQRRRNPKALFLWAFLSFTVRTRKKNPACYVTPAECSFTTA